MCFPCPQALGYQEQCHPVPADMVAISLKAQFYGKVEGSGVPHEDKPGAMPRFQFDLGCISSIQWDLHVLS